MSRFTYMICPECGRRWSKHVEDNDMTKEEICKDCLVMPGWDKDFDSPPNPVTFAKFKRTGERN